MKKLLLFFTLLSTLYGEAKIYVGANAAYQYEIFTTTKKKAFNTTENINLKIGYGDINAYAVEFSIDYAKNDSNILSPNDGDKYGFNVELLKAFDFDLFFNPFVKVGIGAGSMDVERTLQTSVTYGSFNFGGGVFIPMSEHVDFEIGYLYKSITYEKFNLLDELQEISSDQQNSYIGVNFRF
ncbi:outer membrane protein [Sulfurimonas marina]|uniref:Porin family protein n=1 Tax=Sulfurimonas marina TaxID=2590551 RepID=A0A7M3V9K5_9BACT|nr:outer membrane beta-barrel protein [Sulfurimonas marina]QOP40438.1 porin family protein [Sulfurimonas marina]